ncbi:ATP-binding protein [bacterium]|nr:MAG: ATP-binding protein [bacterium]
MLSSDDRQRLAAAVKFSKKHDERPETAWWLITGAPGSGKTTLVSQFAAHGLQTVEDPGRAEFETNLSIGISPETVRKNYLEFQRKVLQRELAAIQVTELNCRTVFDYGIAECLAFMKLSGLYWEDCFINAAARVKFEKIFLLDLVPLDKNKEDSIRAETIEARIYLHNLINELYETLGYQVIRVPLLPPSERFSWIIDNGY